MNFQVVELAPSEVAHDRSILDNDDGFVYEHLKRYCSKFSSLPALTVILAEGKLTAVRGHRYLSIAQELGYDRIRAVLQGTTFDELRKLAIPGLLSLVPENLLASEQEAEVVVGWHVFFFATAPKADIVNEIDARFRGFLNQSLPAILGDKMEIAIESCFDLLGPCFEIRFPTPVTNQAWADLYRAFITSISNSIWPIKTYQGRRFAS